MTHLLMRNCLLVPGNDTQKLADPEPALIIRPCPELLPTAAVRINISKVREDFDDNQVELAERQFKWTFLKLKLALQKLYEVIVPYQVAYGEKGKRKKKHWKWQKAVRDAMRQDRFTDNTLDSLSKKFPDESNENRKQRKHRAELAMKLFTNPRKAAKEFEEG